ncbi:MAG TPA: hypothetical protein VGD50_01900 [Candidatus Baltobacteraceae bacterium]
MVLAVSAPALSKAPQKASVRAWDVDGNVVHLESGTTDISAHFPSGMDRTAELISLYDPVSALFWSMYSLTTPADDPPFVDAFIKNSANFVLPSKFVSFTADSTPMLFVRDSTQHAPSLVKGIARSVSAFNEHLTQIEQAFPQSPAVRIDLSPVFASDYFQNRGPLREHDPIFIRSAALTDGTWRVVLLGESGHLAAVTVDATDYKLVGSEKLSF